MNRRVVALLVAVLLGVPAAAEAADPNPRYCKTAGVPCVVVAPKLPPGKNPGLRPERSPFIVGVGPCL